MAKARNFAICIGIDRYRFLQPLRCARCDARAMAAFFRDEADFEQIWLLCDDANNDRTKPDRANIRRVLRELRQRKMGAGDNLWFCFSGHGMRHGGRDYLMPLEGDREDVESTALLTSYVADMLRECGADNVILFLDACRNQADKGGEGIGKETEEKARQTGVVTLFSCSPNEYSYELESLQQGAFTRAVLDGLGIQGQCATVARLNEYLRHRVPELLREYRGEGYSQRPYVIAEPLLKSHLILLPRYARPEDIDRLKQEALRAEVKRDRLLARQLWIRVNAAAMGSDIEAIEALERLATGYSGQAASQGSTSGSRKTGYGSRASVSWSDRIPVPRRQVLRWLSLGGVGLGVAFASRGMFGPSEPDIETPRRPIPKPTETPVPVVSESPPPEEEPTPTPSPEETEPMPTPSPDGGLESWSFETVTLNRRGEEVKREQHSARYFTEDLGNGVTLEMVEIPGGSIIIGNPEDYIISPHSNCDKRQEYITLPPFFMSKYPVTQAQWKAVALMPKIDMDLDIEISYFKGENLPIEQVLWSETQEFCKRISRATGREYRLPSEREWEYACRAGTTTPFYFGETITLDYVNYNGESSYANSPNPNNPREGGRRKTTHVGIFCPNKFGLYDMHGNVREWCQDKYIYANENYWILRGGSWSAAREQCRSADCGYGDDRQRKNFIGFRLLSI
ncbi:SUMF1/EgtB/PvdO family nonheme iron enzyme [Geitlerinema sp. CS-897]|nr:SUMF1/EgtB/PvdO family nonheme iron enzyme [Geitlerinema sp. CS-897]